MRNRQILWQGIGLAALLVPLAAQADHAVIQGRTGFPSVRDGKDKVWMERGAAQWAVQGRDLVTTQEFRLRYPGGKLEKKPVELTVTVREDYYRSRENGAPEVTLAEAKGFTSFGASLDGRRLTSDTEEWRLNEKKDTATRYRVLHVRFQPNQVRRLHIVSRAPLGREDNRAYAQFVTKDVGGWRTVPDALDVRFTAPRSVLAGLGGVEPAPDDRNGRSLHWKYRKVMPKRDLLVRL